MRKTGEALNEALQELSGLDKKTLLARRHAKFLDMGKKSLN